MATDSLMKDAGVDAGHWSKVKNGEWSTGLFECCAAPGNRDVFCTGAVCPCVLWGENQEGLSDSGSSKVACAVGCLVPCCTGYLPWYIPALGAWSPCIANTIYQMYQGMSTAKKVGIKEDLPHACVKSFCCQWCYACQIRREQMLHHKHEHNVVGAMVKKAAPALHKTYNEILPDVDKIGKQL